MRRKDGRVERCSESRLPGEGQEEDGKRITR